MNENRTNSPSAMIVETSKWSALALVVAGISLGLAFATFYRSETAYRELERENRLLQLKVDEFRMALITAGIDPNPHLNGESK